MHLLNCLVGTQKQTPNTQAKQDGIVDRASASEAVDASTIPESGQSNDFRKLVFTTSCLAFSIKGDSMATKKASLLVVSLGKALNESPPALSGRDSWPYRE